MHGINCCCAARPMRAAHPAGPRRPPWCHRRRRLCGQHCCAKAQRSQGPRQACAARRACRLQHMSACKRVKCYCGAATSAQTSSLGTAPTVAKSAATALTADRLPNSVRRAGHGAQSCCAAARLDSVVAQPAHNKSRNPEVVCQMCLRKQFCMLVAENALIYLLARRTLDARLALCTLCAYAVHRAPQHWMFAEQRPSSRFANMSV